MIDYKKENRSFLLKTLTAALVISLGIPVFGAEASVAANSANVDLHHIPSP